MIEEPERTAELSRNCTLAKENPPEQVSQEADLEGRVYCQRPLDFAAVNRRSTWTKSDVRSLRQPREAALRRLGRRPRWRRQDPHEREDDGEGHDVDDNLHVARLI